MVCSRAEAEHAVSACLYPPVGDRSVGGSVHALNCKTTPADYYSSWNDNVLIVLQCEHIQAVEQADQIFSVPGIDAIFVGPNDLEASMRSKDGRPPSAEATAQAMKHILATCKKYKVAAGVHCFNVQQVQERIAEGWQFLAITSELKMMMDSAGTIVKQLGLKAQGEMAKY
jgi:4-hydroxy-2-oxoheptanedioate aldolase